MTPDQISAECERLFQNGGTRVYVFEPSRSTFAVSHKSGALTFKHSHEDEQVWARRKLSGRYVWLNLSLKEDARFVYKDDKSFGPRVLDRKHGRWMGADLVREMASVIPRQIAKPSEEA